MAATAAVADHRVQIWRAWTGVFAKFTSCHGLFVGRGESESCLLVGWSSQVHGEGDQEFTWS